jgi:hypothetical protein
MDTCSTRLRWLWYDESFERKTQTYNWCGNADFCVISFRGFTVPICCFARHHRFCSRPPRLVHAASFLIWRPMEGKQKPKASALGEAVQFSFYWIHFAEGLGHRFRKFSLLKYVEMLMGDSAFRGMKCPTLPAQRYYSPEVHEAAFALPEFARRAISAPSKARKKARKATKKPMVPWTFGILCATLWNPLDWDGLRMG